MNNFIGRVVNVNDPELAGRVQVRVYGSHDNTTLVPDSDLPWARCIFPVTNPIANGISGPTTGLIVGSTIVGRWIDDDCQIPVVEGTLGKSITIDGTPGDFPSANHGDDTNQVLGNNITNLVRSECKSASVSTIGNIPYNGQSVDSLITTTGTKSGDITSILLTAYRIAKQVLKVEG